MVDDLGLEGIDESTLVQESFAFLLEREPASSILGGSTSPSSAATSRVRAGDPPPPGVDSNRAGASRPQGLGSPVHLEMEHVGPGVVARPDRTAAGGRGPGGSSRRRRCRPPRSAGRPGSRRRGRRWWCCPGTASRRRRRTASSRAGQVARDVGAAEAGGHAHHEDRALLGDVAQRRHPHVAVVPGGREVDVDALRRTARPGPAACSSPSRSAPPSRAERRVDDREGRAVARPPHQPFAAGGHQLAVAGQRPVRGAK